MNPPAVIVSNDVMTSLIEWFVTHLIRDQPAQGNVSAHFIMDWYGMEDEKLAHMRAIAPNLS